MPSIITTPQPIWGRVLIKISWADQPDVDYARVTRIDVDGTRTVVRPSVGVDFSGEQALLSGGIAVFYDTEVPLNTPVTYETTADDGTGSATSTENLVGASGLWLKSPIYPAGDRAVTLTDPSGPVDCVPGEGIFFQSMDEETYASRNTRAVINDRVNPAVAVRVRGSVASILTVVTRTFDDRDDVIDLCAPGTALLLQAVDVYGIGDRYMDVGELAISRFSADHRKPWRIAELPYISVDRPAGLAYGILGNRWVDICALYPTFDDAEAAGLSWLQVMLGYASGIPTVPPDWRTWTDVDTEFASWTAVNSGGRTWEDLLEGR